MAKKSKHKKKHQQTQKVVQKAPPVVMNTIQSAALPQQSAPAQKPSGLEVGELYIRQDILRIVILLAVVVVILIGLYVANSQSDTLLKAGNSLAQYLRLS